MLKPSALELTGLGVRVAVIDSGVNPRHPHIVGVSGGIAITRLGEVVPGAYMDVVGHGTAVMAAIQEKAPAAEYHAVKIFHTSLATSSSLLLQAIHWCIDQQMDVVNLSLGTVNPAYLEAFSSAVSRASKAGTLLVAAREAAGQLCYPGCLPQVFSVGLDSNCPRDSYRVEKLEDGHIFYASGYPRTVPGVPPERNLNGISFAVANMSAFVVRARQSIGLNPQSTNHANGVMDALVATGN